MESNLRRTKVAVKNVDNREHDLFDSDDYFQYHGGMIAAVRALTGRDPKAYIGDSADPSRVKTRDFMQGSNPWALRAISERLLEAAERGLWAEPDPEDLDALKAAYLENEGMLEERS